MARKQKRRIYCKFCDYFCYDPSDFVSHLEKHHDEMIPEDMTPWQFFYYLKTGKTHGNCIMCKAETSWNETTHKYNRFCDKEKCKNDYREIFKNRMVGKYGKTTLLNDPEQQKKMLANRKISGEYLWRDHVHKTQYTGTYEKSFLEFLDCIMNFDPNDVMAPSPHTYYYVYEGKKHFYIPDFFIPSLELEIEIKDGGDNPNMHHKIQDVDKIKEKAKDDVMMKNHYNYIKIVNKDNSKFFEYLTRAKEEFFSGSNDRIYMTESDLTLEKLNEMYTENVVTESVVAPSGHPQDLLEELKKFDYGVYYNGKIIKGKDLKDEDFGKYYKPIPYKTFERVKVGICWDFANFEAYWFKEHGYSYKTYYIELDIKPVYSTHTFLVFQKPNDDTYYYFEVSYGKLQGIHEFDELYNVFKFVYESMLETKNGSLKNVRYFLTEYDATDELTNISCVEYMDTIREKGKSIPIRGYERMRT